MEGLRRVGVWVVVSRTGAVDLMLNTGPDSRVHQGTPVSDCCLVCS